MTRSCYTIYGPAGRGIRSAAIVATAGAALLLGRWLAVRYTRLAPARRGFALAAGLVLGLAAALIGTTGWTPELRVSLPVVAGYAFIVRITVLIECIAAAISLADSRPHRYLPPSRGKPSTP